MLTLKRVACKEKSYLIIKVLFDPRKPILNFINYIFYQFGPFFLVNILVKMLLQVSQSANLALSVFVTLMVYYNYHSLLALMAVVLKSV